MYIYILILYSGGTLIQLGLRPRDIQTENDQIVLFIDIALIIRSVKECIYSPNIYVCVYSMLTTHIYLIYAYSYYIFVNVTYVYISNMLV